MSGVAPVIRVPAACALAVGFSQAVWLDGDGEVGDLVEGEALETQVFAGAAEGGAARWLSIGSARVRAAGFR